MKYKIHIDVNCELYDILRPYVDDEFRNFNELRINPNAKEIYIFGFQQAIHQARLIKLYTDAGQILPIWCDPLEGSVPLNDHLNMVCFTDYVKDGKMLVISGGQIGDGHPCFSYEYWMIQQLKYADNFTAVEEYQERWSADRPYKFLFLNGRCNPNRYWLLEKLEPILDQAIWTRLDPVLGGPVKLLDPKYEHDLYKKQGHLNRSNYVRNELFNNDLWAICRLKAEPYIDTHFSLVTETVFEYPQPFRTEKIWKPIMIGHPFIVATSQNYYKELHNLGFKTFGHLIDESFDSIDFAWDRIARLTQVVQDLCKQDLNSFSTEAKEICDYNRQHLLELAPKLEAELPQRIINFINSK